jgi:hypothetical protein
VAAPEKLFSTYRKWPSGPAVRGEGVIVACDLQQEWLLEWWWENYRRFNAYPVAFVDFGMSQEKKRWCQERGALIALPVPDIFVADRSEMQPDLACQMEEEIGTFFWTCRNAWFKKPLACLCSPFESSLWLDLDCEVKGPIGALFEFSFSLKRYEEQLASYPIYNSGVIVFKWGIPLFEQWADVAIEQNHLFIGDQEVLSWLLRSERIVELPAIYNWSRRLPPNPDAVIVHWHGVLGKYCIYHQINSSNLESLGF